MGDKGLHQSAHLRALLHREQWLNNQSARLRAVLYRGPCCVRACFDSRILVSAANSLLLTDYRGHITVNNPVQNFLEKKMDITEIWKPQEGPQLMAMMCPVRMILFGGARGGGKASSNDAKLLTNSGWRYFSEVRVGDKIVDPETGGTQDVLGVFPQGEKDLYSVVMEDGGSTLVTSDHLWTYRSLPSSKLEAARTHSLQSCLGEGRKVFLPVYLDFSSSRAVRSIEFSHRGEATCISVSATHGLYVTDDYIVTHNTDCAIGKQIYGAMRYGSDWNGLFIRKNYKYFADIRRRLNQLIRAGLPAELVGPAQGTNYLRFQNGANVTLTVIESIEKAEFFQGQSMTCVVIEEACQFSYIDPMIEMLKGCLRSAAGVPTSMFLTANPGGSGHCVRRGEVLTASGWVPIQDVSVGDMVYSVDHTDALVLRRVTGTYAGLYDGDMVTVKARGLTVDCTPNHRVAKVGFTGDKPFDLVEFQNLPGQAYLKRTVGSWEGEELLEFTPESYPTRKLVLNQPRSLSGDLYLELLGWVIAEGYAPQSSESKYFGIAQSSPSKRLLLEGMLKRCGFSYRVSSNAYEVQSPWWWAHFKEQWYCRDKFIPEFAKNVSRRQLWILFNAMMIGDGHWVREGKSGEYYTISRQLADDVCEILVKMGMNVHLSQRQRENREGLSYTVCFKPAPKMGGQEILTGNHLYAVATKTKRKTNIVREHYRGFVYCIEVEETGNFIIRQDGSVWVSGNSAIKSRFMPRGSKPGQIVDDGLGTQMVFIPSNVEDNKVLCDNDPDYVNLLRSIKDPVLRKAWLEGDWDVVLGGFFSDVWNPFKHVVPNFKPPMHWPRIVGMDWGSSTPFSIGWYCISDGETSVSLGGKSRVFPKGAMIRFYEWYGCPRNSVTGRIEANVGLRLTSEDVADRVLELEARMPWLMGTTISTDRIADPSIFAEKDGPSIAEKMSLRGLVWRKGENKRISGWDSLRNLLYGRVLKRTFRDMPDGSREVEHEEREPMLYFTEGCTHMIRTLPEMERDLHNIEDLDDSLEDHACDELRYVVTSRPSTGVLLRDVMPRTQMTDGERDFAEAMQGGSVSGMENLSLPRSADTGFGVSSVRNLSLHIAR